MELRGIDVSEHNGAVEWGKVEGVEFVMLRLGTGAGGFTLDRRFSKNAAGARAAGLRVGAYVYSYARSVEGAAREAEHAVRALEPHRSAITFPVAYDIEETAQAALGKRVCTDMCRAFCAVIEEAGYRPMVYANKNWLQNHLYAGELGADVWLAHYTKRTDYAGAHTIWQHSDRGRVPGIAGRVDLNIAYRDYAAPEADETEQAIRRLAASGEMTSPDYWRRVAAGKEAASAENIAALLRKWAAALETKEIREKKGERI